MWHILRVKEIEQINAISDPELDLRLKRGDERLGETDYRNHNGKK